MFKSLKVFFILCLLTLVFSQSVLAASSTYLTQAKKYYDRVCKARYVAGPVALDCYVFDKVDELETAITSLATKVTSIETKNTSQDQKINELEEENASQDQEISELEDRVTGLESSQPQDPLDIIFFNDIDILTTTSQSSDWYDSSNYSELVLTYQCKASASTSEYGAPILLLVSNDKITSATVFFASSAECHSGGSTTVDVGGKYYQVVVGNNTNLVNPPMTAYVAGRFR